MIKALFLDLDGTLLTSAGRISPVTLRALERCRSLGIRVFTATARPPRLQRMLGLTPSEAAVIADGGVFYNGGCILCDGRREYTPIDPSVVQLCLDALNARPDVNYALQLPSELHACRHPLPEESLQLWGITRDDLLPVEAASAHPVIKFVVFSPAGALPGLHDELLRVAGHGAGVYLTGRPGGFRAVEVVSRLANKKLAAEQVLAWCGIDSDEAAVFGDDANDAEMLAGFRHSVAMGNASAEIRSLAAHTTLSNDDDGIAYALSRLLGVI